MNEGPVIPHIVARSLAGREFVNDISFVPRLNVIFAFISKNASSLLKSMLAEEGSLVRVGSRPRNPHVRVNSGFLGVDDIGASAMDALLLDPGIPKVVVGRDPLARLLSAWRSRVDTWQLASYQSEGELQQWLELRQLVLGHAQGGHAAPPQEALTREIPFSMLVDYVSDTPSWLLDRHLAPQTFLAATDLIRYDVVGTVERLRDFLDSLEEITGVRLPPPDRTFSNQSTPRDQGDIQVDRQELGRIVKRYRDDYSFFGYEQAG